jgi:hypothetical protein
METSFSLRLFYEKLVKDFYFTLITTTINNAAQKEEQKKADKKEIELANDTQINEIKMLTDCIIVIEKIDSLKNNFRIIYDKSLNYLKEIKAYFSKENNGETKEHDIYRAYGFLWGINFLSMKAKLEDISLFNYKNYENFAKFLEVYGNSKNLSKNYNKNFKNLQEEFKDKEINVKSVSGWIEKLDNKKLIPMTKKPKKKIKKIKKQNCDEDIKAENEIINKKNNEKENNNTKEAPQNQTELNQNNINNIQISSNNNNIIEISNNNAQQKSEIQEDLDMNNKENKINNNDEKINTNEIGKIDNLKIDSEITKEESSDKSQKEESDMTNAQNNNIIISNEIAPKVKKDTENKDSGKNQELYKIIDELTQEVRSNHKELTERINRLEENQLLLYNQISLYQSSRDIFKSIYYYYFKYLDFAEAHLTKFDKLKKIISFLQETYENKSNLNTEKDLTKEKKITLIKYFKFHFFISRLCNKIIHRNFNENQKKIIEEKKLEGLLPLTQNLDFIQCFDSLKFFIENGTKNQQMKEALKFVYENHYKNDSELEEIKDEKGEAFVVDENGDFNFVICKKDVEDALEYFKSLVVLKKPFIDMCNNKLWGKEEL